MGRGSGGGGLGGLRNYASAHGVSVRKVSPSVHGGRYQFNVKSSGGSYWARNFGDARRGIRSQYKFIRERDASIKQAQAQATQWLRIHGRG